MSRWIAFTRQGERGFGVIKGDSILVYRGDLFEAPTPTGDVVSISAVTPILPCQPGKFIGLWNNYHAQASRQALSIPEEPLYFLKPSSSFSLDGGSVCAPASYDGRVVYEGELGIVIGQHCKNTSLDKAREAIFGYTCVNDITAIDLIAKDPSFAQWTRAKGFDGFGAFGPVIATDLDWETLSVKTLINGRERQNYACSDMILSPDQIVHALSQEMTLCPGDVIACGTSLGVLPMRPGTVVEVIIEGIGTLKSTFIKSEKT